MKCNSCGHENLDNAAFCSGCGKKLETNVKCPKCGFDNQPGASFCSACGEKLVVIPVTPSIPQTPPILNKQQPYTLPRPQTPPAQRPTVKIISKKPLFAVIAAVLVVAIVVSVLVLPGSVKVTPVEASGEYQDGMLMIQQDGKYGFMDTNGNIAVPCIYEDAHPYENGTAQVKYDGGWQEIDRAGQLASSTTKRGEFLIDISSIIVTPSIYDSVFYIVDEELAIVRKDGKWGYVDSTGREAIYDYDSVYNFNEGLAAVRNGDKYGFIDTSGKEVIPYIYDAASSFSEGLAAVKIDGTYGKYGFIDTTGKEAIPFIYNNVEMFSNEVFFNGLAAVHKDDKYGFIDTTGKEVIPSIYDSYSNTWKRFYNGIALVSKDDMYTFLDITGKELASTLADEEAWTSWTEELRSARCSEFNFLVLVMYYTLDDPLTPQDGGKIPVIIEPKHVTDGSTQYIGSGMYTAKGSDAIKEIYNVSGDLVVTFNNDLDKFSANFAKGAALLAEGKTSKAKKYLKNGLKLHPDNPYVLAMLNDTSVNTADVPGYNVVIAPTELAGFDEKFQKAVALYESESPDAQAALEALFTEYPQEAQIYSFLADAYEERGDTETALSILRYGYEITGSQTLRDRFDSLVVKHDLGEKSDEVQAALEFAEKLAEITGKSEDFEKGKDIGKQIYDALNGIRYGR